MRLHTKFTGVSKKSLVGLVVSSVLTAGLEATALVTLVPLARAVASDDGIFRGQVLSYSVALSVTALFFITIALVVSRALAQACTGYQASRIASRYEAFQRQRLFDAYIDAEWKLQSKSLGGHLQDIMTTAVQRATVALKSLCDGIVSVASLVIMIVFAIVVNPPISLTIAVAIVVLFFATRPLSRKSYRLSRQQRAINLNYAHDVSQAAAMAREIKVFNASGHVKDDNRRLVDHNRENRFGQLLLSDLVTTIYQSLALIAIVIGLGVVWWFSLGQLASLAVIVLLVVRALTQSQAAQGLYHKYVEVSPFVELVEQELEKMQDARERTGGAELERVDSIAFSRVTFSYLPGERVLHDVSFEARRGEAIGIVGPSGAGKSTFLQLLLRLRHPDSGAMLVNGQPAGGFSLSSWFERIGYVPQEPVLLHASVADNIRFHRPDVSDEAIVRAARLAHIHDEVMSWPKGYDTEVGERGGEVSGGQRQRLCIARALLLAPDVVILDEPTSALDAHSEALMQQTMIELRGEVTLFIVAHRLSTLNICDRIMVFSEGVLQAFADRQALATDNAYYSDALRLSRLS